MSTHDLDPRQEARDLLVQNNVTSAAVAVEKIAKSLNVKVEYAPLEPELSGLAHIRNGVAIVGINALHSPVRQRFTLAHELGHVRLHWSILERAVHVDKGSLRRDSLSSAGTDEIEIQANTFAAELLMPEFLLKEVVGDRSVDLEDDQVVQALAKKFRVSEAAIRYRIGAI
jgi:Zn-dependent peptidase ImmA (M78 family)